jgi:hypothetical protein
MVQEEQVKGYWVAVDMPTRQLWNEAVDTELHSLDISSIWDQVDKVGRELEVGSKWLCKVKRLADRSSEKFKARLVVPDLIQCPCFDLDKTSNLVICFDSLRLLLVITKVQG